MKEPITSNVLQPKKHRVFLSSTLGDLEAIRSQILDSWRKAGLFYYAMEHQPTYRPSNLDKDLRKEIDDSDIFVIILKEFAGSNANRTPTFVEREYNFAASLKKPMLAYFSDQGKYGSFAPGLEKLKQKIIEQGGRYRPLDPGSNLVELILADIVELLSAAPPETFWVRSALTSSEISSFTEEHRDLRGNLKQARKLISSISDEIPRSEKDALLGPLIDAELYPNLTETAYSFAGKKAHIRHEILQDSFTYEYCIGRFLRYRPPLEAVYDRKLNATWYLVPDKTFTWNEAFQRAKVAADDAEAQRLMGQPRAGSSWQVPTIENLATLLIAQRVRDSYLDSRVFPGSLRWFWSNTEDESDRAFYLETLHGQVLSDPHRHRKGLLLLTEGKLEGSEPRAFAPASIGKAGTPQTPREVLEKAAHTRRIYSVYTRLDEAPLSTTQGLIEILGTNDRYVSSLSRLGARPGRLREVIRSEMARSDCYLVSSADINTIDKSVLEEIRTEARFASQFGLPVFLICNMKRSDESRDFERIALKRYSSVDILQAKRSTDMGSRVVEWANKAEPEFRGWIRNSANEAIQKAVRRIEDEIDTVRTHESYLLKFLQECGATDHRQTFEDFGVLSRRPAFGEFTHFVSKHNPVEWLFRHDPDAVTPPLLYTRYPDRFSRTEDQSSEVQDKYLEKTWFTEAEKGLTYPAAENLAAQNPDWRLPKISELMTLVSHSRGSRKYMDEIVFPTGRWFWSSSQVADQVYFLDFNYPHIDLCSKSGDLDRFSRKTALLIKDDI